MVDAYNANWCADKHKHIDEELGKCDKRLSKVENRFLAMITILIMNLLGIIGTLSIILIKM